MDIKGSISKWGEHLTGSKATEKSGKNNDSDHNNLVNL